MIHQEQSGFLHPGTFPLTALHHHGCGVEVLLLLPEHDLHVVLVLDGSHEGIVGVRSGLKAGHDGQVKVEEERCEFSHSGPSSLYSSHLASNGNLQTIKASSLMLLLMF